MTDPNVIDRLKKLQNGDGVLTPSSVVDDAQDPDSPLHEYFEWDDTEAAKQYRIIQARDLIRSVRLVLKEEKHQLSTIAYVRNPDAEKHEQGYSSVASLRSDKEKSRRALLNELSRAESALQRAYNVAEALGLSGEVESLIAQLRNISKAA